MSSKGLRISLGLLPLTCVQIIRFFGTSMAKDILEIALADS